MAMMMRYIVTFSILILLMITKYTIWCVRLYESNDDAHGRRFGANEKFIVGAFNAYQLYSIHPLSKAGIEECPLFYPHPELYVYSLAVVDLPNITTNSKELAAFVQIAENMTSSSSDSLKSVVLSIVIVNVSFTNCTTDKILVRTINHTLWSNEIHQEYMLLKVDPQQKYVYVFTDLAVFSYELATDKIDRQVFMNDTAFWQNLTKISVRSFDLTNQWALLAGYISAPAPIRSVYAAIILALHPLRLLTSEQFHGFNIETSETLVYNSYYDLSVAIAPDQSLAAIGAPSLNSVTLCKITANQNHNQSYWTMVLEKAALKVTLASGINGFGRSVTWLEDEGTHSLVVLVDTAKQQVWSSSQIRAYSNISISTKNIDGKPDFVFPNSQQRILSGLDTRKLSILQLLAVDHDLLFLSSDAYMFYIPSAPLGLCSVMVDNNGFLYTNVFQAQPCVGGSYKNKSSIGPCTLCPPQTKSALVNVNENVTAPMTICTPCEPGSFCPLGAAGDVNLSSVASYTQTFVYPTGGATDNYDDLLLENFFTFGVQNAHCLVVSPLFWLILIFVLCFTIWLLMHMMKSYEKRSLRPLHVQRRRVKLFLKHVDIIHEGERWISGLATFAILVIIGMTVWFAADYVKLYPIETSADMRAACDASIRNARFDNALQLPLPMRDGSQWQIFERLDAQPFTMSIDVINTAARCDNITVQQNRGSSLPPVDLAKENCAMTSDNVTVSFSFALPAHQTNIQVDIVGPYFIGALRFCLRAPPDYSQRPNYVHALDVCTFFFTSNQTIGSYTEFTARLVKVVNVTEALSDDDDTIYDGRWYPKIIPDALSDELILSQYGEYMRYLNDRTSFVIYFWEESYFLQNTQKPIVQVAALAFHTLLFISLVIEMFALCFLIFKMCCMPMFKMAYYTVLPGKRRERKLDDVRKDSFSQTLSASDADVFASELSSLSTQNNQRLAQRPFIMDQSRNIESRTPYIRSTAVVDNLGPKERHVTLEIDKQGKPIYQVRF